MSAPADAPAHTTPVTCFAQDPDDLRCVYVANDGRVSIHVELGSLTLARAFADRLARVIDDMQGGHADR